MLGNNKNIDVNIQVQVAFDDVTPLDRAHTPVSWARLKTVSGDVTPVMKKKTSGVYFFLIMNPINHAYQQIEHDYPQNWSLVLCWS